MTGPEEAALSSITPHQMSSGQRFGSHVANSTTASLGPIGENIKAVLFQAEWKKKLTLLNSQSKEQHGSMSLTDLTVDRSKSADGLMHRNKGHKENSWAFTMMMILTTNTQLVFQLDDVHLLSWITTHCLAVDCDCIKKPQVLSGGHMDICQKNFSVLAWHWLD